MKSLPTELLHNIFILLPIIQKLECMYVCRQWASLIRSRSLFHTITLRIDEDASSRLLEKFIDLIHKRPDIGSQVEELTIANPARNYSKIVLLSQLPNVNKIVSRSRAWLNERDTHRPALDYFDRNYRIQYLDSDNDRGLARLLIASRISSQLVTLKAPLNLVEGVSSLLQDMPILKYLTIKDSFVTFSGLEELHNTLSSLETLKLHNVTLSLPTFSTSIVPATQLTRLSVIGGKYISVNQGGFYWSKYISQKYTSLKHFHCLMDNTLALSFDPKSAAQLGYTALLQSIGPQLESWSVDYRQRSDVDVLAALDSSNCRIKNMTMNLDEEVTILDGLARTELPQYIENLVLYQINPDQDFYALKLMENLKSLTLHFTSYSPTMIDAGDQRRIQNFINSQSVNLSIVFGRLTESVESVSVALVDVNFNEHKDSRPFHIKELTLDSVRIQGRIDRFIFNNFPYLHSLTLKDCLKEDQVLCLWNHHFSYLELDQASIKVHLITSDVKSPRVYCTFREHRNNYSDLDGLHLPVSLEELDDLPFVTLICGSVKRLFLGKYEAYLVSDEYQHQSLIK